MSTNKTFEDMDLSKDEVKRLGEALKDEKFRKMLVEYAEEISNPENRRKAEEEISQMENERGMKVQFIHPAPGYVLKTTVDGSKKAFINICQNDKIEKPKANKQVGPDGKRGVMWQIPHSFAPPRDDHDKSQTGCTVFDVVFHPDTYRMAMSNERFKKLVEDTAVDGIESQFGVTLDKKNIKRPKMKFKGTPQATVIRERLDQEDTETPDAADDDDFLSKMPYPYDNRTSLEKSQENQLKHAQNVANDSSKRKGTPEDNKKFTVPKYTMTHVSEIDFSDYRDAPDARTSTCPTALVYKIELPLLSSAAQASLDIFEKRLTLESVTPAAYKLDLALPYRVNEDDGTAKFDKSKRILTVTLPVVRPKTPPLPFSNGTGSYDDTNLVTPLIESISNNTEENNLDLQSANQHNHIRNCEQENVAQKYQEDDSIVNDNRMLKFPQNVKWILPSHQFSQDNETVSFIISVKNVEEDTVEKLFPQTNSAVVQFMSIGAGCFPVYYRLYVQFPMICSISPEHCSIDVSSNNLVFIILKDKTCRGLWDSFSIGIDETDLEEKQFLTESNLQKELSDLDKEALEEATMPGQVEQMPELSVVEMTEKRLTIDIKPSKGRKWKVPDKMDEEEEEEYEIPSSADIEVVHKHPPPDLHSILKQRSVSESSEDISNGDPDSPRSEGEELSSSFNKKRSVSFSNHVDHASFKSSASVSSMTPALKSKRRRQRRRDEKKHGRVRCNSGGTSSSEECLHSVSDSYSHSEEELESISKKSKGDQKTLLHRAVSDPGPNIGLSTANRGERGSGEPGIKTQTKNKHPDSNKINYNDVFDFDRIKLDSGDSDNDNEIVNDSHSKEAGTDVREERNASHSKEAGTDVREERNASHSKKAGIDVREERNETTQTNGKKEQMGSEEEMSISKRNQKIVSEIKERLAEESGDEANGQKDDSDDDDFVDAVSSLAEESSNKNGAHESADDVKEDSGSQPCPGTKPRLVEELGSVGTVRGTESSPGKDRSDAGDTGSSKRGKSDVETILSWEDGVVSHEHETKCAFQFSNSLMFDLDVE